MIFRFQYKKYKKPTKKCVGQKIIKQKVRFFHKHWWFTGQQGKGETTSLTPLYHFYLLHRHSDISWVITAESLHLHITSSQTQTGNTKHKLLTIKKWADWQISNKNVLITKGNTNHYQTKFNENYTIRHGMSFHFAFSQISYGTKTFINWQKASLSTVLCW